MSKKNVALNSDKKNRQKKIRSIIQLVIVMFLAVMLIQVIFLTEKKGRRDCTIG